MPVAEPMVATPVLVLLHVPPPDISPSVWGTPTHIGDVPPAIVIGATVTFTVAVADTTHPPVVLLAVITLVVVVISVVGW